MAPSKKFTPVIISIVLFGLFPIQTGRGKISQELPKEARQPNLFLIQNESAGLRGVMAFRVTDVQAGSPASRAGLQVNDIILAVDGVAVYGREELDRTLLQPWLNPGARIEVTFGRFNSKTGQLEVEDRTIQAR